MTLPSRTENRNPHVHMDPAVLEILASRICHDLISPVGAVHNGVEFLQDTDIANGAEAIELIAMSAAMATAKLQAFRLAYGAGGRDTNLKPSDVYKTFGLLVDSEGKVRQSWNPAAPLGFEKIPLGYCKILMGALMMMQECLPKGGAITVAPGGPDCTLITGEGPGAAPRAMVEDALKQNIAVEDMDPRLVHPYVLSVLAAQYGFSVAIEKKGQDSVTLALRILT